MKKLLLLTTLGFGYCVKMFAQSNISSSTMSLSTDSSLNNQPRPGTMESKICKSPSLSYKDVSESDGFGIITNNGPRLNPRAVSFVQEYIEKYGNNLNKMKDWAMPFFNMMDGIFVKNSLPPELKYIAVIESRLNPVSVSWAGAVGPWQFMPGTAVKMGLKVNRFIDERTNYIKSTEAAAKYLGELYKQFGDWLLAIAAYNGGSGSVLKAIRKSGGSQNFWDLQYYLPAESRNYVKKFIGTHYLFEGQGGMTTLTRAESKDHYGTKGTYILNRKLDADENTGALQQTVTGKYHSQVIASITGMDISDFNRYNPSFDKVMASADNTYELKLPKDKMDLFNLHKNQILNESIQLLLANAVITTTSEHSSKPVKKH